MFRSNSEILEFFNGLGFLLHRGSYIMGHYKMAYCQLMKDSMRKNLCILCNKIVHHYLIYWYLFSKKCLRNSIPELLLGRNFECKILVNFNLTKMHLHIEKWCTILLWWFSNVFRVFWRENLFSMSANSCMTSLNRLNSVFLEKSRILWNKT